MESLSCSEYAHFEKLLAEIVHEHGTKEIEGERRPLKVLFRGQSNAEWDLETTLERQVGYHFSVENYLRNAFAVLPEIEKLTREGWELESIEENMDSVRGGDHGIAPRILSYNYLVYLRHHGFPSPLLDWSQSSDIATYFAFRSDRETPEVSVHVYIEHPQFVKSLSDRDANISVYKHDIETHCRHYVQQAQYSVATKSINGIMSFCRHEEVFDRGATDQDLLFKISIPRGERPKALEVLKSKEISEDCLFHPEDVLIEKLGKRCFESN